MLRSFAVSVSLQMHSCDMRAFMPYPVSPYCLLYYDTSGVFGWQRENYEVTKRAMGEGGGRLVSALFGERDLVVPRREAYYTKAIRLRRVRFVHPRTDHWLRLRVVRYAMQTMSDCSTITYLDSDARILTRDYIYSSDMQSFFFSPSLCVFAAGEPYETRTFPLTPRGDLVNTHLNTGFLTFKRDACAESFLSRWWRFPIEYKLAKKYMTEWPFDQGALARMHLIGKAPELRIASELCSYNCPNGTYVRHTWGRRHRPPGN
jgi:hypothetical protein